MKLKETIENDINQALLEKDKQKSKVLRHLKSMVIIAEENQNGKSLAQKKEKAILLQATEQHRKAIDIYNQQGRPELAKKEEEELYIIEQYLPLTYNKNDLREIIFKTMEEEQIKDMNEVQQKLPIISEKLAHKTEHHVILTIAEELINRK